MNFKDKVPLLSTKCIVGLLSTFYSVPGLAEDTPSRTQQIQRPAREVIWSFDSDVIAFNNTFPDNSKLKGAAAAFNVGYGRSRENYWILARLHLIAGPWGTAREGAFDADFSGTLFDVEYGSSFPGTSLRSGSCPVLTLAGGYLDMSGKNVGGNKKAWSRSLDNSNYFLEQEFETEMGELVLMPAIGWSWTKPVRALGNEPDQLLTRIESSSIKLGVIVPLYSRSRLTVAQRDESTGITGPVQQSTITGPIQGYALVTSLSLWLGI